ncbi:MAG: hypothetical protein HYZ75_16025 [Elusimicrobia bacterium]|nr:hypothetical protein [Elusimicrobiota bacterium]
MARRGWTLKVPEALFWVLSIPVAFVAIGVVLYVGICLSYGYELEAGFPGAWFWLTFSPGILLSALYAGGRLQLVSSMPSLSATEPPPPATLALPGAAEPAVPVRSQSAPLAEPRKRRAPEGILFWTGVAWLGLAWALAVLQTESFDAVLGIKLGGIRFQGTYWNRWWFVFYGFTAAGVAQVVVAMLLFVRRLNRRDDDRG